MFFTISESRVPYLSRWGWLMRSFGLTLVMTMVVMTCCCNQKQETGTITFTVEEKKAAMSSVDRSVEEQNRLNSFFYAGVVPKLQSCWSNVQGKGAILFKYTFTRDGTKWVSQGQQVERSNLPQGQEAVALRCMQEAARGSSFQMEAIEAARNVSKMVIHWTWPVPFPSDVTEMGRMVQNNNGPILGAGCQDCDVGSDNQFHCHLQDRFGWYGCEVSPDGRSCTVKAPVCGEGWPQGGGIAIAW